jgi:hypothetical protein
VLQELAEVELALEIEQKKNEDLLKWILTDGFMRRGIDF